MAFNLLFPTPVWDVEPDEKNEKIISEIQEEVSPCIAKIKSDKDILNRISNGDSISLIMQK